MNFIKNLFKSPKHSVVVQVELDFARLELLKAHASRENAEGHVSTLEARVKRLEQVCNQT